MKTNPDLDAVIADLDAIKGIGVWTAELTLFRGMQRLEVLPADDFGIRRVISNYYCNGQTYQSARSPRNRQSMGQMAGSCSVLFAFSRI